MNFGPPTPLESSLLLTGMGPSGGDGGGGGGPTNTYVQPDGSSNYFQPDGSSYYLQP
jgi:hypothetical protein